MCHLPSEGYWDLDVVSVGIFQIENFLSLKETTS